MEETEALPEEGFLLKSVLPQSCVSVGKHAIPVVLSTLVKSSGQGQPVSKADMR